MKHLFRNSRIIGRRFRLAHIVFGRKVIEVATFRATQEPPELPENVEGEGPEAGDDANPNTPSQPQKAMRPEEDEDLLIRSDNVFGTPEQDAFRRDFTVNGLFYDPETAQVIDHVGGMVDLERRVLRTIGDPDVRFREDPVRIVRAVKFAARLHFAIEPKTFDAMIRNRGELTKAAKPRLAEEVIRLAQGGAGAESFRLLDDLGVLPYIAPAVAESLARANAAATRPLDAGSNGLFWRHLEAIDRWPRGPGDLSRATVLACVYGPVFREAMASPQAQRDPGAAFFNAIRPAISDRLLSRREADRIKLIYVAQRRLESPPGPGEQAGTQPPPQQGGRNEGGRRRRRRRGGGGKGLAGRDYFREAVAFFRLDATARGKSPDVWTQWEALLPQAPPVREVLPFRRRAEEAMASTHHELPDDEPMPTPEEIEALNRLPDDEEFGRHRRRRGGRLSENARERERMETTRPNLPPAPRPPVAPPEWSKTDVTGAPSGSAIWRAEDLPPSDVTPVAPLLGEDGKPLPRLAKPKRARERAPVEVAPPVPVAPPPPKLTPAERIARAMSADGGLVNPYTGRKYVPRKIFEEVPQPVLAPAPAMSAGGAMETVPAAVPYTLDEFEPPTDEKRLSRSIEAPATPVEKESKAEAPKPQGATPSGGSEAASGQPGGEGRRRRRRRGRRGRGRGRGPGGAPQGGSTPPAGTPPAGGGNGNAS